MNYANPTIIAKINTAAQKAFNTLRANFPSCDSQRASAPLADSDMHISVSFIPRGHDGEPRLAIQLVKGSEASFRQQIIPGDYNKESVLEYWWAKDCKLLIAKLACEVDRTLSRANLLNTLG